MTPDNKDEDARWRRWRLKTKYDNWKKAVDKSIVINNSIPALQWQANQYRDSQYTLFEAFLRLRW